MYGRSQEGLGNHLGIEVCGSAEVTDGDIDNAVLLGEDRCAEEKGGKEGGYTFHNPKYNKKRRHPAISPFILC